MRLASHLGKTKRELHNQLSSQEFLKWLVYLDEQETNKFDRLEYYLAQIAMEVRRSVATKKRRSLKLKDFMISFARTSEVEVETTDDIREEKMQRSKSAWLGWLQPNQ